MRASWVVSAATAFVILGASILVFLNPVWVGFEQARSDVTAWTQSCPAAYQPITNAILVDLVLGGDFDVQSTAACSGGAGSAISLALAPAERSHMADVRGVFRALFLLVALSAVGAVVSFRRARVPAARATWLRAVRRGATALGVVVAVLGAISLVAFDAVFEAFHRLFFAPGSYDFDPRTSRLVQLFPDQFWSETTLALGGVIVIVCAAVVLLATRRLARLATGRPEVDEATPPALRVGKVVR